jgi:hypothetical protein
MGGMVGMLIARAYGDRIVEMVMPGMIDEDSSDNDLFEDRGSRQGSRPTRLSRRLRRNI